MQTINEAKSRFIFHCQFEKTLSQKTITSYNIDTDQFIKFIQIEKYPQQINLIEKNIIN